MASSWYTRRQVRGRELKAQYAFDDLWESLYGNLETLAKTALRRDSLRLRSLPLDFMREYPELASIPRTVTGDQQVLAMAAALLELLAQRAGQLAPAWTVEVGPLLEPVFLLESATRMKRLCTLCESEAPEPLRKRGLYVPPDFLTFA